MPYGIPIRESIINSNFVCVFFFSFLFLTLYRYAIQTYITKHIDDKKWWNRYDLTRNTTFHKTTKTSNIELTSYGLLAMLANGQFANAFPFFKWLLGQRNSKGGFVGTQDTVMGLQALAEFAERIPVKDNNIDLVVNTDIDDANAILFTITPDNALVQQTHRMPTTVRSIHVNATGHGFALFQLSYKYYVNDTDQHSSFRIVTKTLNSRGEPKLKLEICVR